MTGRRRCWRQRRRAHVVRRRPDRPASSTATPSATSASTSPAAGVAVRVGVRRDRGRRGRLRRRPAPATIHRWVPAGPRRRRCAIEAAGTSGRPSATCRSPGSSWSTRPTASATCARPAEPLLVEGEDVPVLVRTRGGLTRLVYAPPPVRRGRLGRLPVPLRVQHPRLRADREAHPRAAAGAPDLRGPELRDLLVLPRPLDFHPDAVPVPYNHPNVDSDEMMFYAGGDYRRAQGLRHRRRLDLAAPGRLHPRPAAGRGRGGDRRGRPGHTPTSETGRDGRHLPPAGPRPARHCRLRGPRLRLDRGRTDADRRSPRLVDDAGLFPPTPCPCRRRWPATARPGAGHPVLTHRFLCPASRLDELRRARRPVPRRIGLIVDTAGHPAARRPRPSDSRSSCTRSHALAAAEPAELSTACHRRTCGCSSRSRPGSTSADRAQGARGAAQGPLRRPDADAFPSARALGGVHPVCVGARHPVQGHRRAAPRRPPLRPHARRRPARLPQPAARRLRGRRAAATRCRCCAPPTSATCDGWPAPCQSDDRQAGQGAAGALRLVQHQRTRSTTCARSD